MKGIYHPDLTRRTLLKTGAAASASSLITGCPPPPESTTPNILLIVCDQLTEKVISAHGHPWVETPNIDRLIASGTSFTESYCADTACSPARASLLTGRLPSEHGVVLNRAPIDLEIPNIGDWMRDEAGYQPWYMGKWHIPGVNGWDIFRYRHSSAMYGEASDVAIARTFDGLLLNQGWRAPFFAVISLLNPHDIAQWVALEWTSAEASSLGLSDSELPDLPPNFNTCHPEAQLHLGLKRNKDLRSDWSEVKWRTYRWWYARQVEMVDGVIGRIMDTLRNSRYGDDTVVIFTSDHGDMQGEHGLVNKQTVYESAARVPVVVSWPGVLPEGVIDREHLVSHIDIVPTICSFAGVERPPGAHGRDLSSLLQQGGSSLSSQMQHGGTSWRSFLQVQCTVEGRMIRTQDFKYTAYRDDPVEQLFDLSLDPDELNNLSEDSNYACLLEDLRALQSDYEASLDNCTLSMLSYEEASATL